MTLDITLTHPESEHSLRGLVKLDHLVLNTFKYTVYKPQHIENDTDAENNVFIDINNCHYYTDEQYNSTFKTENKISIICVNSRSLYANFHNIKDYLNQLTQQFNIILISQ